MWSEILIAVCCLSSLIILFYNSSLAFLYVRILLALSILSVIAVLLPSISAVPYEELFIEWGMVSGISLVITVLTIVIREMIPVYARYPFVFSFLPLSVIALYPFISEAQIIKNLLNQILQGGAIFVGLVFYITLIDKLEKHYILLLGIFGLLFSYLFFWFTGDLVTRKPWIWQILMALSIIPISYKFTHVIDILKNNKR